MRKITDTTEETLTGAGPLGFLAASMGSGGIGQAIMEQEAQGQHELVSSMQLPRNMGYDPGDRARYEKLGFKFSDTGDRLFLDAELPAGWKKERTDHSMWSNIVDDKGRARVSIFYKAAFYDRDAFMNLTGRFESKSLSSKYDKTVDPARDGEHVFLDKVTGKEIFSCRGEGQFGGAPDEFKAFVKQYLEGKDPYDFDAVYE